MMKPARKEKVAKLKFSISERGVLHVDTKDLLNNYRVKEQIKALKERKAPEPVAKVG